MLLQNPSGKQEGFAFKKFIYFKIQLTKLIKPELFITILIFLYF